MQEEPPGLKYENKDQIVPKKIGPWFRCASANVSPI